jgi:hypothetical protein
MNTQCPKTAPTQAALDAAPLGARQCTNCCHPVVLTTNGWVHLAAAPTTSAPGLRPDGRLTGLS